MYVFSEVFIISWSSQNTVEPCVTTYPNVKFFRQRALDGMDGLVCLSWSLAWLVLVEKRNTGEWFEQHIFTDLMVMLFISCCPVIKFLTLLVDYYLFIKMKMSKQQQQKQNQVITTVAYGWRGRLNTGYQDICPWANESVLYATFIFWYMVTLQNWQLISTYGRN